MFNKGNLIYYYKCNLYIFENSYFIQLKIIINKQTKAIKRKAGLYKTTYHYAFAIKGLVLPW